MTLSNPANECPTIRALEALRLSEALVVAGYEATNGRGRPWNAELRLGVAGAVLLELALAGRINLEPDCVRVCRDGTTGNLVADRALDSMVGRRARPPVAWVSQLAPWVLSSVRQRLVTRGMLLRRPVRRLWIIAANDYPVDPDHSIRPATEHLRICTHDDPRPVALATLMVAMGLLPRLGAPFTSSIARSGLMHYSPDPPGDPREAIQVAGEVVTMAIRVATAVYASVV